MSPNFNTSPQQMFVLLLRSSIVSQCDVWQRGPRPRHTKWKL